MDSHVALALSVLMHVTWNLIARQQPRESSPLWWVLLAHLLIVAPWGFWAMWHSVDWSPSLAGLLTLSALANVAYFRSLAAAYSHAPVSVVYPLVRSSPLLIACWGTWLFDHDLGMGAWLGMGISVLGLLWLAGSAWTGQHRSALPWAALAMVSTSIYSLSDQHATVHVDTFMGLMGYLSVGYAAAWLSMCWQLQTSTGCWYPRQKIGLGAGLVGGLCIGTAYALVIHAMRELTAAEAVSFTNAGIVLANVLSMVLLHDRHDWRRRLAASLVITAGLTVMAVF